MCGCLQSNCKVNIFFRNTLLIVRKNEKNLSLHKKTDKKFAATIAGKKALCQGVSYRYHHTKTLDNHYCQYCKLKKVIRG